MSGTCAVDPHAEKTSDSKAAQPINADSHLTTPQIRKERTDRSGVASVRTETHD